MEVSAHGAILKTSTTDDCARAHNLRDLQPYVCTYPDCVDGHRLYGSRQAWFDHESTAHRQYWRPAITLASISALKNCCKRTWKLLTKISPLAERGPNFQRYLKPHSMTIETSVLSA